MLPAAAETVGPANGVVSVDIRRHSVRDRPEAHLFDAGRSLARDVASSALGFDRVVSSPVLRAIETARALGYPYPEVDPQFESVGSAVEAIVPWPSPFRNYQRALDARVESVTAMARQLARRLTDIARHLPAGGRALVVTHGGVPELSTVALRPRDDTDAWGGPCRCLEGSRVTFVAGAPMMAEILRVDPRRTRI